MSALIDSQLAAIAHPTRRAILRRVLSHEVSAGDLADDFAVTRPAVSQHIRVLVDARLLLERRDRQRRLYRANRAAVEALRNEFDAFWSDGLARLKAAVESDVGARRPK